MSKKSKLDMSPHREVVLILLQREDPAARPAPRYGISEAALYHWQDKFLQAERSALSNG